MAAEIQIMIPQYGELNRIYSDFIVSHTFSFDRQKFITDFYKQYNDTKAFETAILDEKEYERCKAEYEKEKEELNRLYELQRQARKEAFQYIKNCCGDIYNLGYKFCPLYCKTSIK